METTDISTDIAMLATMPLLPMNLQPRITAQGIEFPENYKFDDWLPIGNKLSKAYDNLPILYGSWLAYGEARYPGKYQQAMLTLGLADQTLYNAAWVFRKMQGRFRPTDVICYSAQAATASLPAEHSESVMDWAIESGATVKGVMAKVREIKGTAKALTGGNEETGKEITIVVSVDSMARVGIDYMTWEQRETLINRWISYASERGVKTTIDMGDYDDPLIILKPLDIRECV